MGFGPAQGAAGAAGGGGGITTSNLATVMANAPNAGLIGDTDLVISAGISTVRSITVLSFGVGGGSNLKVSVNGTDTNFAEGVDYTAATSNNATATSIATAVDALSGVAAVAVGAVVNVTPAASTYQFDVFVNGNYRTFATASNPVGSEFVCPGPQIDSVAFGPGASVDRASNAAGVTVGGTGGIAIGKSALARGGAVVIGKSATDTASQSSTGSDNVLIGNAADATGSGSYQGVAVGYSANINGTHAVCVGKTTTAGWGGVALGPSTQATNQGVAIGNTAVASGTGAVALGWTSSATGNWAMAFGRGTDATDAYSVVFGQGSSASDSAFSTFYLGPQGKTSNFTVGALPTDVAWHATSVIAGTGNNNVAGSSIDLVAGAGTGTGAVSTIALSTPTIAGAGDSAQAVATRLTVSSTAATFTVPVAAPSVTAISNGAAVTATGTAVAGERMVYDPTGGTFTINAPASPVMGTRFAVKNRSASVTAVTISGNGNDIEDPTASFALAASFSLSGDGIAAEWEYDGTQWLVI